MPKLTVEWVILFAAFCSYGHAYGQNWQPHSEIAKNDVRYRASRSVAYLRISTNHSWGQQLRHCSGVLITPSQILTNEHCLRNLPKGFKVHAHFDWGTNLVAKVIDCSQVVKRLVRLDYAVLKCKTKKNGHVAAISVRKPRSPIFLTQHNCSHGGLNCDQAKKVSVGRIIGHYYNVPVSGHAHTIDELYVTNAYAKKGSSGSGVFDAKSGKLVGLYKGGQHTSDFVPIAKILRHFKRSKAKN